MSKTWGIDVTTDFAPGDILTVQGLEFTTFSALSASDNLELELDNAGSLHASDDKTIEIGASSTLSSAANQVFGVGDPDTVISNITISEGAGSSIFAADDIRITIPAGFNMIWDTSITSFSEGGSAVAKIDESSVTYEDANRTAVIDVTSDFNISNSVIGVSIIS